MCCVCQIPSATLSLNCAHLNPSSPNKKWTLFRFPHFKYEEIERLGNRPKVTRLTSSRTGFELHLIQPQNFLFNPLSSASDFSSHLGHARSYSVKCLASLSMPLHSSNPTMWEASVRRPPSLYLSSRMLSSVVCEGSI